MFLLSNEVMRELVTATHTPSQEDVTTALWSRFGEEADISIVWERGAWTIADQRLLKLLLRKEAHQSAMIWLVSYQLD